MSQDIALLTSPATTVALVIGCILMGSVVTDALVVAHAYTRNRPQARIAFIGAALAGIILAIALL